ncbi:MAG: pyruvate kinase, partial [Candidatus Magasanikbacteria bacterium RIFOXYA2_FULL_44_8]
MMLKHTKIGVTVGPACESVEILRSMVKAGMNFARLNFSHGNYESHAALINNLRAVEKETGEPIAILQDLQGPKIRLGLLPTEGVKLEVGQMVTISTDKVEYSGQELPLDYAGLQEYLRVDEIILIDDGRVELKIVKIEGPKIFCEIMDGGIVSSHKGLNFPNSKLGITILSNKDKDDLRFGVKSGVDIVALSFVRSAKDILDIKFLIKEIQKETGLEEADEPPIAVIAKIELHEAVENIQEILDVSDGVMIARGDLGLEMPAAQVPLIQKKIIDLANACAKPVIVATQMLDSMREASRPTRAEVSDVANAVIDHADALLLTNETAVGTHPVLVVKTMSDIIFATEKSSYDNMNLPPVHKKGTPVDIAITELSRLLAEEIDAKIILAASISGETGRMISHVRPTLP